MRVLLINSVCGIGSTGRICAELAGEFKAQGHEAKIAYGRSGIVPEACRKYAVRIGSDLDVRLHGVKSRLLDAHGLGSAAATKRFLAWAEDYNPDLLWLHNIHGYYINYELLFQWIKRRPGMEVRWTLHDCWAFTGHCSHFTVAGCEKWKTACAHCPQKKRYPASVLLDRSAENYNRKRDAFTGVEKMTLITPSNWLANLVRESFLRDYPIEVRYHTIDRSVFRPVGSDFRARHGLAEKIIVLGVASVWDDRKGLDDFIRLAELLDDRFAVVLVGLTERQIGALPPSIVGLERTNNAEELAKIYTAADIFVNPSREETFGLTSCEAISCGTPVIVYENTACEEIAELYGGYVVRQDVSAIYEKLMKVFESDRSEKDRD